MPHATALAFPEENLVGWERAMYAFLVEKERRSGSRRTVEGYSRMLQDFFGRVPKASGQGDRPGGLRLGPRQGSLRQGPLPGHHRRPHGLPLVLLPLPHPHGHRPEESLRRLERPRTSTPPARGLSAEEVRRLLAVIPDTPPGLRDRAIILTLVLTGRRRAEVFRLTAGDLSFENDICFYAYGARAGRPDAGSCPVRRWTRSEPHWRPTGASLSTCPPMNRCGPLRPPRTGKGSAAPPFTGASAGIWRKPVFALRAARSSSHGRQAPPGCRGEHRGRVPVPGSQLAGRDHHLPAPPGRPRGPGLGQGGGGDRALDFGSRLCGKTQRAVLFFPYDCRQLLLGCVPQVPVPREADIFKVEENGSERCELAPNSSFVRVRVPVRIVGEGRRTRPLFATASAPLRAKEAKLLLAGGFETTLRFRVPLELFRARERFSLGSPRRRVPRLAEGPLGQALGGRLARQDSSLGADS